MTNQGVIRSIKKNNAYLPPPKKRNKDLVHYLLLAPAMLILLSLVIYPLVFSFTKSLTDYNLGIPGQRFIGLANYAAALKDAAFLSSLAISLQIAVAATTIELVLGFATALLLQREFFGKRLLTVLIVMPMMVTPVVVGIIWLLMFQPGFSVVNGLLMMIGINGPIWLQNEWTARFAVVVADVWQWTPFFTLILLAGLLGVSPEIIEASKVDGASNWQSFWHIQLPMLSSLTLVLVLIRLIDAFKTFDSVFIMTAGGPGRSTEVLSLHIYRQGLPFMNVSYAAAMSYLFLIILTIATTLMIRRLQRINKS
jgi:multiple sugar transport system permease protein